MKKIFSLLPSLTLVVTALFTACGGDDKNGLDVSKLSEEDQVKVLVEGYELMDGVLLDAAEMNEKKAIETDLALVQNILDKGVKEGTTFELNYSDVKTIENPDKGKVVMATYTDQDDEETKVMYIRNSNKMARCYTINAEVVDSFYKVLDEAGWKLGEGDDAEDYSNYSETEKEVMAYLGVIAASNGNVGSFVGTADITYEGKPVHFVGLYTAKK